MLDIKRIPIPALIGLVLTALFVLAAILAPWISPHDNAEIVGDVWEPMSAAHWLGTDNLGRDLLSRMIYGARIT
ncbi:MAG: ABC transporter permease, partial [Mesorhizobium sp.]